MRPQIGTVVETGAVCAVGSRRLLQPTPTTNRRPGACRGGSAVRGVHPCVPERGRFDGLRLYPYSATTSGATAGA